MRDIIILMSVPLLWVVWVVISKVLLSTRSREEAFAEAVSPSYLTWQSITCGIMAFIDLVCSVFWVLWIIIKIIF